MPTTVCYLDDPSRATDEMFRVLRPGGVFVVGFISGDSDLAERYRDRRDESPFYRDARFHTPCKVAALLLRSGFVILESRQTLFSDPEKMSESDPVRPGHRQGGYVAIRGEMPH